MSISTNLVKYSFNFLDFFVIVCNESAMPVNSKFLMFHVGE